MKPKRSSEESVSVVAVHVSWMASAIPVLIDLSYPLQFILHVYPPPFSIHPSEKTKTQPGNPSRNTKLPEFCCTSHSRDQSKEQDDDELFLLGTLSGWYGLTLAWNIAADFSLFDRRNSRPPKGVTHTPST